MIPRLAVLLTLVLSGCVLPAPPAYTPLPIEEAPKIIEWPVVMPEAIEEGPPPLPLGPHFYEALRREEMMWLMHRVYRARQTWLPFVLFVHGAHQDRHTLFQCIAHCVMEAHYRKPPPRLPPPPPGPPQSPPPAIDWDAWDKLYESPRRKTPAGS